ncbi:MAG: CotH kinase family protein [Dysgonamonadaceae bacterium]|jgi:hypothetical protein|nr:CotH kinase family protein [Dysgonamonadaceae bacterium]
MKKIFYLLLLFPILASAQDLVFNEISSRNVSGDVLNAENGFNFNNWVEVYNPGSVAVNLKDYVFSRPTKSGVNKTWTPGNISVPAGGFAVVYFERQDSVYYRGDAVHNVTGKADYNGRTASFKLEPDGGTINLLKNGERVAMLTYPELYRNASYGRTIDGCDDCDWAYFATPTKGTSNSTSTSFKKQNGVVQTAAPTFSIPAGFYTGTQMVSLTAEEGAAIYYTVTNARTDKKPTVLGGGAEPTVDSTLYEAPISVSGATVIRAIAVAENKLPSNVVTSTYLVDIRKPKLPVISLTIDDKFMYDVEVGMYDDGKSPFGKHAVARVHDGALNSDGGWITQGCNRIGNYNQPWDRPANFEFFDKEGKLHFSQEVDIAVAGQCTRQNTFLKSLKVKAKEKFGNDKLEYDFFASKPGHKYESVMLRFAGTEGAGSVNGTSWFRDALMSTLTIGYMEVDVQAYQPAVIFLNGEYWGMVNIRERTNDSNVYSNFGIGGDDVYVVENSEMFYPTPPGSKKNIPYVPYEKKMAFDEMYEFIKNNDMSDAANYARAGELLDIDNYIDLLQLGVYGQNWDWPQNNQKLWRPAQGGKWRFIAYDNDFAINNGAICALASYNKILAPTCDDKSLGDKFKHLFVSLLKSPEFKSRFLTRAEFHASTTFKPSRLTAMVDSFKAQITDEVPYFLAYRDRGTVSDWSNTVTTVRNFVNSRANAFLTETRNFILSQSTPNLKALNVDVSANIANANIKANGISLPAVEADKVTKVPSASDLVVVFEAEPVSGYQFVKWTHTPIAPSTPVNLITEGDTWNYYCFGKDAIDLGDTWKNSEGTGTGWVAEKQAPLGYSGHGKTSNVSGKGVVKTRIPACSGTSCTGEVKYIGAYFIKTINLSNVGELGRFTVKANIDDCGAFYVNGVEVYREKIPANYKITSRTVGAGYSLNEFSFPIPQNYFKEGENIIAVEIHQSDSEKAAEKDYAESSDLYFEMSLQCVRYDLSNAVLEHTDAKYSAVVSDGYETKAIYDVCADCLPKKVYVNEVFSAGASEVSGDWIELYNAENATVDLGGYKIVRTNDGNISKEWIIPENTTIQSGGYIVFNQVEDFVYGISHDEDFKITLIDKYGVTLDVLEVTSALYTVAGQSVAHYPDGTGELKVGKPTKNTPNAIKSIGETSLRVYPNPVVESLTVEAESPITSIVISDISGRTVISIAGNGINQSVSTARLTSGIYLLTVETEQGRAVKKIIKK